MTSVPKDKTVKITVMPESEPSPNNQLADYMRSQLKTKSKIQDVDL